MRVVEWIYRPVWFTGVAAVTLSGIWYSVTERRVGPVLIAALFVFMATHPIFYPKKTS